VGAGGKLEAENNSLLPPGLMEFGSAATSLAIDMTEKGASSEAISQALYKQALGDLPKSQQPATLIAEGSAIVAGFTFGLMGAPVLTATGVAVGAVGGATFNLWEQYDEAEKAAQAGRAYEFDKFSFALDTTIGGLTSGKGVLRTASLVWAGDMSYGYVKNENKTYSSLAAAGGAVAGQISAKKVEKIASEKLGNKFSSSLGLFLSGYVSGEVEDFLNE
jgi:hypothetical protein